MSVDLVTITNDLAWRSNKTRNWKQWQLSKLKAADIDIDHTIKTFIKNNSTWQFNLEWANPDIKKFAVDNNIKTSTTDFDFFVICDLEFGKLPVVEIENTIKTMYNTSTTGGYFSFQSYYLNWQNDPAGLRKDLDDNMDIAVEQWVKQYLNISTYENSSLKISKPLTNIDSKGRLIAGSDFMYTHGNTRFWLWKK